MNLQEIIIKSDRESESLHGPDGEDDNLTLTQFTDTPSDPHLRDLLQDLVGLTSPGQCAAVLSLYLPQFDWGGREI